MVLLTEQLVWETVLHSQAESSSIIDLGAQALQGARWRSCQLLVVLLAEQVARETVLSSHAERSCTADLGAQALQGTEQRSGHREALESLVKT